MAKAKTKAKRENNSSHDNNNNNLVIELMDDYPISSLGGRKVKSYAFAVSAVSKGEEEFMGLINVYRYVKDEGSPEGGGRITYVSCNGSGKKGISGSDLAGVVMRGEFSKQEEKNLAAKLGFKF